MSTLHLYTPQSVFVLSCSRASFSNVQSALARLPDIASIDSGEWQRVRTDVLETKPNTRTPNSYPKIPSHGLEKLDASFGIERAIQILRLSGLRTSDIVQYNRKEKLFAVPRLGALSLAVAGQYLPRTLADVAPTMTTILEDSPLPAGVSPAQVGNALLLLNLASSEPESVFRYFVMNADGRKWLNERCTLFSGDVQSALIRFQVFFIQALNLAMEVSLP
jgi:hypothetical protein